MEACMKNKTLAQTLAFALLGGLAFAGAAAAQEVRVTVSGAEARGGMSRASLQTESQFMRGEGAYSAVVAAPEAPGEVVLVFENVAPGDYALAVMHDEDGDFEMRRNEAGMPQEGWALSNADALMGPPTFAVNKFSVADAPVSFSETFTYPHVPDAE
jgi:uncharacterized protein (DUF2141 family)